MNRTIIIWFFFTLLIINSLEAQDSARIKTDLADKRINLLVKKWYLKPFIEQATYMTAYTTRKIDSAKVILEISPDGSFVSMDRTNAERQDRKRHWIFYNDGFYLQTAQNKDEYVVYTIQNLQDTSLVMHFIEIKNITEPFLCSGVQIYQMTEIPAQFGKGNKSFEEYIVKAFSTEQLRTKADQYNELVEFVVTCEGEIYVPFTIQKKSDFKNYILTLLKKMPRWTPAIINGRKVNELKRFQFSLINTKLALRKI